MIRIALACAGTLLFATVPNLHAQGEERPVFGRGFVAEKPEAYAARPATPVTRGAQPAAVDLSRWFPPPGNQGAQGSCVAWSTAYARSYYERVMHDADLTRPANIVSPAYIYNATHPNAKSCDDGTLFGQAFGVLAGGALSLAEFPYNDKQCFVRPPDATATGGRFRIDDRILVIRGQTPTVRENAIKQALASGRPVLFGMKIDDRFMQVNKFDMPKRGDRCERNFEYREPLPASAGGHAMVIVGYNNARQAFKVLNSWSTAWGCDGFVWIAYDTVTMPGNEFYIVHSANASHERLRDVAKAATQWADTQSEDNVRKTIEAKAPDTAKTTGSPVQQQLDALLIGEMRDAGCSLLAGKTDGQGNALVAGILPSTPALRQLKERLGTMPGLQRVDISRVQVRAWPQCEALIAMLPIIDDANGLQLTVGGQRETTLRAGEPLKLEAITPERNAYLYMVYLQVGGEAIPVFKSAQPLAPRSKVAYPPAGATSIPRVAAPFGDEMAIALSSSDRLPELESIGQATDREFLTVLDRAIRNAQKRGRLQLSAAVVPVKTVAR